MRLMSVAERFDPAALDELEQRLLNVQHRRQARNSLTDWCRFCGYEPAAHHRFIIKHLEALADGHQKGLSLMHVVNFETGQDCSPILVYKTAARDKGIALNFCPFCGSPLNLDYQTKEEINV